MNYNKVVLIGRLTNDCEYRVLQSGMQLAKFRIAVNDNISDKTLFMNCTVFGKMAENLKSKFIKGVQLLIDGRLELDSVSGDDGKKRYFYSVIGEKIQINYDQSEVLNKPVSATV